jgi:hypothetical protein
MIRRCSEHTCELLWVTGKHFIDKGSLVDLYGHWLEYERK